MVPPTDRRRTRRRRGGDRARWLAARTANAARHALLITGIGSLVVIGALLTFVLIPRRADRALAAALATLPPARDTLTLLSDWRAATAIRDSAAARVAALTALRAVTASPSVPAASAESLGVTAPGAAPAPSDAPSLTPNPVPLSPPSAVPLDAPSAPRDSAAMLLQQQLARVRQAPLIESYRTLAASPALRGESRAQAAIDTMEAVHREREAYAALGGPDARYAALTARLTQLGQRLERVADAQLAARRTRDARADAVADSLAIDSTPSLLAATMLVDTVLTTQLTAAESTVVRADRALQAARQRNRDLLQQQDALRARTQVTIPPIAMLLAALVLGISVGFAVVLGREIRRPKVGDADELEALTHAQIIVHTSADRLPFTGGAPRRARASDGGITAVQPQEEAWSLLHLLLTTTGDVARDVQVLADRPLLAGTVGVNLAAAAARESRATVLVDLAAHAGAVVPLLPAAALVRRSRAGDERSLWDATRALPLGRDVVVDLLLPRRLRPHDEAPETAALPTLVADYDIRVYVADSAVSPSLPMGCDVVLCARLGVTPLAWLAAAVRAIDADGRRVRAVLLWAGELPLAG